MISTKKIIGMILIMIFMLLYLTGSAQTYTAKNVKVGIFSTTPLEDIKAMSEKATAVLVATSKEIAVQVPMRSLEFERKLMQEHFNENYMKSDKYPFAKFKGKINESINFAKDGNQEVTVTGILSVHGVDQKRTIPGRVSVKNGIVRIDTEFKVPCASHNIKIPKLVFAKIAEVITVRVSGNLSPLNP
jgi:hypothetical protein